MLTEEQKDLIRDTYVIIARREYSTGEMLYNRLFEKHPHLKALFKSDMREMRLKFIQTIGTLVAAIELREDISGAIQHLGIRHVNYGVKKEDYEAIGEAFLWTLEQVFEDRFTPEVRDAWATLYNMIAETAVTRAYESPDQGR